MKAVKRVKEFFKEHEADIIIATICGGIGIVAAGIGYRYGYSRGYHYRDLIEQFNQHPDEFIEKLNENIREAL